MICELLARSDDAHDLVRYVPTIGIRSCPSKYHSVDSALLRNLHDKFGAWSITCGFQAYLNDAAIFQRLKGESDQLYLSGAKT